MSLLVQVIDKTPGRRDGRDYTHVRYKATLALGPGAGDERAGRSPQECLARVREIHGVAGPWVVEVRKLGRSLTVTPRPEPAEVIGDVPPDRLEAEGQRVVGLPDDAIVLVTETLATK